MSTIELITPSNIATPTVKSSPFRQGYKNNACMWLMPTRGSIPARVHTSLMSAAWLPNSPRFHHIIERMEVAAAYNEGFALALDNPLCANMPWIWTHEEDNVQPQDVFFKLFKAIWKCIDCGADMPSTRDGSPVDPWVCPNFHPGLDAVAGLYRAKAFDFPTFSMAFGDPKMDKLDFRGRDTTEAEEKGELMEVNGVAMGCTLWRKDLFKDMKRPWFKTMSGGEGIKIGAYTQDLYFSRRAKEEKSARFAVHCGCYVGHMDLESGEVF